MEKPILLKTTCSKSVIDDLKDIIIRNVDQLDFPEEENDSIRIKHFLIKRKNNQWNVYDFKEKKGLGKFFSKAIAIVSIKNMNREIYYYDRMLEKHSNDIMFYQYSYSNTDDPIRKEIAEIRYNESVLAISNIKQKLRKMINTLN